MSDEELGRMEEKERMEKKEKDRRKEQVKLKSFFLDWMSRFSVPIWSVCPSLAKPQSWSAVRDGQQLVDTVPFQFSI